VESREKAERPLLGGRDKAENNILHKWTKNSISERIKKKVHLKVKVYLHWQSYK
jgi:hypothetical protein